MKPTQPGTANVADRREKSKSPHNRNKAKHLPWSSFGLEAPKTRSTMFDKRTKSGRLLTRGRHRIPARNTAYLRQKVEAKGLLCTTIVVRCNKSSSSLDYSLARSLPGRTSIGLLVTETTGRCHTENTWSCNVSAVALSGSSSRRSRKPTDKGELRFGFHW